MSNKHKILAGGVALPLGVAVLVILLSRDRNEAPVDPPRELARAGLELRDGVLFARGEPAPFDGMLVERFPEGTRRIALEISGGRAHGISRGWYENGQIEVEEHFVEGVSHGLRTRWYANGEKKSEAQIVDGRIEGTFTRWHDNGRKAAVVTMVEGKPHGLSESWDADGRLKSRAVMKHGELVTRELFEQNGDEHRVVTTGS